MVWVILTFSMAIPFLYVAGAVLCIVTYWVDKYLFLRFYRNPPRYGTELAREVRTTIEYGIIMHMFFGLYMISNPEIFSTETDVNETVQFLQGYARFIGLVVTTVTGVESSRFSQVHTIIYAFGIGVFLILFVVEKVSRTFSRLLRNVFCCCLYRDTETKVVSTDLFRDISPEA